jgi:hypothetical protein
MVVPRVLLRRAQTQCAACFTFLLWDYFLKNNEAVLLELLRAANLFQLKTRLLAGFLGNK